MPFKCYQIVRLNFYSRYSRKRCVFSLLGKMDRLSVLTSTHLCASVSKAKHNPTTKYTKDWLDIFKTTKCALTHTPQTAVVIINDPTPTCHMDLNAVFSWAGLVVFGAWLAVPHIPGCSSVQTSTDLWYRPMVQTGRAKGCTGTPACVPHYLITPSVDCCCACSETTDAALSRWARADWQLVN